MREIKSRAWIKIKGLFYYDFAKVPYDLKMEGQVYRIFSGKMDKSQLLHSEFEENLFIGLQDVNGKEIYESDIVELDKKIYYISFDLGSFCMTQKFEYAIFPFTLAEFEADEIQRIKIIGNIYENPELLEQGRVVTQESKPMHPQKFPHNVTR